MRFAMLFKESGIPKPIRLITGATSHEILIHAANVNLNADLVVPDGAWGQSAD
jgi:hypothetical protein